MGNIASRLQFAWIGVFALCIAACTGSGGVGVSGSGTNTSTPSLISYTVGGTVSGLSGSGLKLQDNAGDNLTVAGDGSFTFKTALISGNSYNVTVSTQPSTPTQACTVTNGTGTIAGANITDIAVVCVNKAIQQPDTIGVTVVGLSGLGLVLQNDGGDNLDIPSNGSFTFSTALPSGMAYNVTVLSPPIDPNQNCAVTDGSGTTGASNVTNVSVSCTTTTTTAYTIGGTVTGLPAGATLVLQDNGRDNLTIPNPKTDSLAFTFATPVPSGSAYNVTALSIEGPQSLSCAFTNASGSVGKGPVTNVLIACQTQAQTTLDVVQVNVSGLSGEGLVLLENGGDNLPVASSGTFAFSTKVVSGSPYNVTVLTQPANPSQNCVVSNGSGTANAAIINVAVSCATPTTTYYTISGTITGYTGSGLVLQNNGVTFPVPTGGTTFQFTVASGTAYAVTVQTPPGNPTQNCSVSPNGSGTANGNVNNVVVSCVTPVTYYTISGTITGYTGSGLVLQNNGVTFPVPTGGTTFQFTVASGTAYAITVQTPPSNPTQTCSVSPNGSGTANGNVNNVVVSCVTPVTYYTISGTITGYTGSGLVLQNNGVTFPVPTGGTTFQFTVASGTAYSITTLTLPSNPTETCTVTNGSGTATGNFNNVVIACTAVYPVVAQISGQLASGLTQSLQLNVALNGIPVVPPEPPVTALTDGVTQVTLTQAPSGETYAVSITQQPSTQPVSGGETDTLCVITNGSQGSVAASTTNPSTVWITCLYQPLGYVYVADETQSTVLSYMISSMPSPSGAPPTGSPLASGPLAPGALMPTGSQSTAAGNLGISPAAAVLNGTYLYVANSTTGDISVFSVDQNAGTLSSVIGPFVPAPPITGVNSMTVGTYDKGPVLYVTTSCDSAADTGGLFEVLSIADGPASLAAGPVPIQSISSVAPVSATLSPSSSYFYVVNGYGCNAPTDEILGYGVDASSTTPPALTPFMTVAFNFPATGDVPNSLAADSTSVYVGGLFDGIYQYTANDVGDLSAPAAPFYVQQFVAPVTSMAPLTVGTYPDNSNYLYVAYGNDFLSFQNTSGGPATTLQSGPTPLDTAVSTAGPIAAILDGQTAAFIYVADTDGNLYQFSAAYVPPSATPSPTLATPVPIGSGSVPGGYDQTSSIVVTCRPASPSCVAPAP